MAGEASGDQARGVSLHHGQPACLKNLLSGNSMKGHATELEASYFQLTSLTTQDTLSLSRRMFEGS